MIPVFKPFVEKAELDAACEALELGWLGMGSFVNEFEQAIHGYLQAGDRHVAAVSTGHAALHLALLMLGVGSGDEVLTPSFNNIADFQAILATGARPVFCDIDPDTLCIDLVKAEPLVSPRTKAVIAMDYACLLCEHDRVAEFAARHDLRVIHDAAHAFGSRYRGKMVGAFSDICTFSFDPVKTITCIDGGALIVRTQEELEAIHELRLIGMGQPSSVMYKNQRAWTYDVKRMGFRYHMANLHAAMGLAQIAKMPVITETRRATCRFYNAELAGIRGVSLPKTNFGAVTPFLYYLRVLDNRREALRGHLKERGIDTGIHWQPGHWFALFKDCRRGDLSVTERVGREILSLPLHSNMSREDMQAVVSGVRSFFEVA